MRLFHGLSLALLALSSSLAGCAGTAPDSSSTSTATQTSTPTPGDSAARLRTLAPRSGYGIYDLRGGACTLIDGTGLSAPVPVASVFKLWVLDAVARRILKGDLTWDTPVTISDSLRSDPSGEVYTYPTGRKVPLSTLVELMISVSDNTATDHVIDLVGRDAISDVIREVAPDGATQTLPLLSTADMARLKFVDAKLGRTYAGLTSSAKANLIASLPQRVALPWLSDPTAIDRFDLTAPSLVDEVEWFASGPDLCRTMADLARLSKLSGLQRLNDILSANPGLPPEHVQEWTTAWFKGGSEPGVVTLAYRLANDDVDRVVVVALSDPARPLVESVDGQSAIDGILQAARG